MGRDENIITGTEEESNFIFRSKQQRNFKASSCLNHALIMNNIDENKIIPM